MNIEINENDIAVILDGLLDKALANKRLTLKL